jgi:flagellar biosynthesis protein
MDEKDTKSEENNKEDIRNLKAAALRYDPDNDRAPHIVASGSGYAAQRILKTAVENGIAIYHDDSAATMLAKLHCGKEIPPELYQIVVDIYLILLDTADSKLKKEKSIDRPIE